MSGRGSQGIHRPLTAGHGIKTIAAELGLARNTVRRFTRAADPEELLVDDGTGRSPSILDESEPCLRERWNTDSSARRSRGGRSAPRASPAGTTSSATTSPRSGPQPADIPAPPPAPPKARQVTGWIMTRPGRHGREHQAGLDAILAASPELAAITGCVRAFAIMVDRTPWPRPGEMDERRHVGRRARTPLLRRRPSQGLGRRHPGPDHPLELRPCRGQGGTVAWALHAGHVVTAVQAEAATSPASRHSSAPIARARSHAWIRWSANNCSVYSLPGAARSNRPDK